MEKTDRQTYIHRERKRQRDSLSVCGEGGGRRGGRGEVCMHTCICMSVCMYVCICMYVFTYVCRFVFSLVWISRRDPPITL